MNYNYQNQFAQVVRKDAQTQKRDRKQFKKGGKFNKNFNYVEGSVTGYNQYLNNFNNITPPGMGPNHYQRNKNYYNNTNFNGPDYSYKPQKQAEITQKEMNQIKSTVGIKQNNEEKKVIDYNCAFDSFAQNINSLFNTYGYEETEEEKNFARSGKTYFTDEYSLDYVYQVAISWYENVMHLKDNFKNLFNPYAFCAYIECVVNLILMSNPQIVGINGFTKDHVTTAKLILENICVPNVIYQAVSNLRPITITKSLSTFVLLPYTYENTAHRNILTTKIIQRVADPAHNGEHMYNINLKDPVLLSRAIGGASQNHVIQARVIRKSALITFLNYGCKNKFNNNFGYFSIEFSHTFFERPVTHKQLKGVGRDGNGLDFQNNLNITYHYIDLFVYISNTLRADQAFTTLAVGLMSPHFHISRFKQHLPLIIETHNDNTDVTINYLEKGPEDKLVPWFVLRNRADALAMFNAYVGFSDGQGFIDVPPDKALGTIRYIAYANEVNNVVTGNTADFISLSALWH